MTKKFNLETLKSELGRSIYHYSYTDYRTCSEFKASQNARRSLTFDSSRSKCDAFRSERRKINCNYFSFPIWTFSVKRKRKDAMSVSSCNSVNLTIMHNMDIMIKKLFVMTLVSRAIMIITWLQFLIIFKCPFKFKRQCRSLSTKYKFQKRSIKMFTNCTVKLDVKI